MLLPQCHLFLFSSWINKIAKDVGHTNVIDMESPAFIDIMVINNDKTIELSVAAIQFAFIFS